MMKEIEDVVKKWERMAELEKKVEGDAHLGRIVQMVCLGWYEEPAKVAKLENVFGEVGCFD